MKSIFFIIMAVIFIGGAAGIALWPSQDAQAQSSKWSQGGYADCIIKNLKDMKTDRAVNLLDEYCQALN